MHPHPKDVGARGGFILTVTITSLGHVEPGGILTLVDPATYLAALQALSGLDVVVTITAKHKPPVQP